jgi:hypothetical protein
MPKKKIGMKKNTRYPRWQPIVRLPLLTMLIDIAHLHQNAFLRVGGYKTPLAYSHLPPRTSLSDQFPFTKASEAKLPVVPSISK